MPTALIRVASAAKGKLNRTAVLGEIEPSRQVLAQRPQWIDPAGRQNWLGGLRWPKGGSRPSLTTLHCASFATHMRQKGFPMSWHLRTVTILPFEWGRFVLLVNERYSKILSTCAPVILVPLAWHTYDALFVPIGEEAKVLGLEASSVALIGTLTALMVGLLAVARQPNSVGEGVLEECRSLRPFMIIVGLALVWLTVVPEIGGALLEEVRR